jgi:hypothetical protein
MGPVLSTSVFRILRTISLVMARVSDATPTTLANRTVDEKMSSGVTVGTLRSNHLENRDLYSGL